MYRDELRKLEEGCAEGLKVHHAFSRDIEGKKVYVQDLIKQNAAEIWAVLESGGRVYVAGARGGMPKGVREAFQSILSEEGRVDDASAYVDRMIKEGRYREEVW